MNGKMKYIADEIGNYIYENINNDYLESIFYYGFSIEDLIMQVLFIECRFSYLKQAETHPLTYFVDKEIEEKKLDKNIDFDSIRKQRERTIKYSKERFNKISESLSSNINMPDYETKKIFNNQFPSHDYSDFQYWEICNIHDMELVKSIVDRKITTKDFTNNRFNKMSKQYNDYFSNLVNNCNLGENTILNSLKYYTLESKYNFDFVYKLVTRLVKDNIQLNNNHLEAIKALIYTGNTTTCVLNNFTKLSQSSYIFEYPLIMQRDRIINFLISDPKSPFVEKFIGAYLEANAVVQLIFENDMHIKEWIFKNVELKDMETFFEIFNVFRTFVPNKAWGKSKIRLAKNIYSEISFDYKTINSKNRP